MVVDAWRLGGIALVPLVEGTLWLGGLVVWRLGGLDAWTLGRLEAWRHRGLQAWWLRGLEASDTCREEALGVEKAMWVSKSKRHRLSHEEEVHKIRKRAGEMRREREREMEKQNR